MTWKKRALIFVCCYNIAGMMGCTNYIPVVSDVLVLPIRAIEASEKHAPTTRPWHFEGENVVYEDREGR